MDLDLIKMGAIIVVKLSGEFDLSAADDCRRKIDETVIKEGTRDLLFDMEKVDFIDSSGLGLILGRYRKATEKGGKVAISNASPKVIKILELSGIMRLIPVYPTTSQALRYLGRGVG